MIDQIGFIVNVAKLRQRDGQIYKLVSVMAFNIVADISPAAVTLSRSLQRKLLKELIPTFERPSPRLLLSL